MYIVWQSYWKRLKIAIANFVAQTKYEQNGIYVPPIIAKENPFTLSLTILTLKKKTDEKNELDGTAGMIYKEEWKIPDSRKVVWSYQTVKFKRGVL